MQVRMSSGRDSAAPADARNGEPGPLARLARIPVVLVIGFFVSPAIIIIFGFLASASIRLLVPMLYTYTAEHVPTTLARPVSR